MADITLFGATPKTIFLNGPEQHKLHLEFEVKAANTVYKGQPVKLDAAGTIVPAAAGNGPGIIIGYSIHDGAAGELVTVACRGYAVVNAEASTDALVAGPVKYAAMNSATGYAEYDDATVDTTNVAGFALDGGDNGDVIRVLVL